MPDKNITVVMPVYNEAGMIEYVVRDFYEKVVKKIPHVQFVIAEDGSTDGTKDILHKLKKEFPFTLVTSEKRKGYTEAFYDALKIVNTEFVLFSDSDNQHDPNDIYKLLKEIKDCDIVSGYKMPRRDPGYRIIISKAYNLLIWLLFGLKMKDIDSGLKLIKKKVIEDILKEPLRFKYCAMSEFILKAYLGGYTIIEIPVSHFPRKKGNSVIFTPLRIPVVILILIKELLKLKFKYGHIGNK